MTQRDEPLDRKRGRLVIGAKFIWAGEPVEVTSFKDETQSLVACAYHPKIDRYEPKKIRKRFTISMPEFISTYKTLRTMLSRDFLARQSAARRIDGSDCLSWRSPTEGEAGRNMSCATQIYLQQQVNWPTPNCPDGGRKVPNDAIRPPGATAYYPSGKKCQLDLNNAVRLGLPAPDSRNTNGKSRGLWATPAAIEIDAVGPRPSRIATNRKTEYLSRTVNTKKGKLNPDWVGQLMRLETGWTDLGSWATAVCHNK